MIYAEPLDGRPDQFRLRQIPEVSGAIIAMDPYTGRVFSMVGGFSFDQSEFNRATQAMRQPGSSFKPFVYSTALDNGYTPSSVVLDAPIDHLAQGRAMGSWRPENFEGKSGGPHTLRYGIEHSINQMTVRLARDVGMPLIAEYAKRFGIYDDLPPYLSMSLGAGETTLMRMTTAYSMLANGGKKIKSTLIDRIQDRWGHTIYKHDERICEGCNEDKFDPDEEPKLIDKREQVLDPLTAYQITSIMEGVIQRGTGQVIKSVGKHLAGKTGTTNDAKDLWFVGYSPDLTSSASSWATTAAIARRFGAGRALHCADLPRLHDDGAEGQTGHPVPRAAGHQADLGRRAHRPAAAGQGTILEAFKPGTAPPESYAGGDASPRQLEPEAEPDQARGLGDGRAVLTRGCADDPAVERSSDRDLPERSSARARACHWPWGRSGLSSALSRRTVGTAGKLWLQDCRVERRRQPPRWRARRPLRRMGTPP